LGAASGDGRPLVGGGGADGGEGLEVLLGLAGRGRGGGGGGDGGHRVVVGVTTAGRGGCPGIGRGINTMLIIMIPTPMITWM